MKQTLATLCLLISVSALVKGQQLYMEVFSAYNRTAYEPDLFSEKISYLGAGGRIAAGADHFQLGAEARTNLTNPSFTRPDRKEEHLETYYGAFLRSKISRYPAMRFGLVLRAGAGVHQIETAFTDFPVARVKYDPVFGFNGGIGFSIPLVQALMLELGYTYNYVDRLEFTGPGVIIPSFNSSYHSLQAGLSLNFVFGKRAREYRQIREKKPLRNG